MASNREEFRALAPLVVATLNALNTFSDEAFRVHMSVSQQSQDAIFGGLGHGRLPAGAWLLAVLVRWPSPDPARHSAQTNVLRLSSSCRSFSRC